MNHPSPEVGRASTDYLDRILRAILGQAVLRKTEQRLIGPSGQENVWLIDMRRVFLSAETLDAVAEAVLDTFVDHYPYQVGGLEVGAIPLIAAILMKSLQRQTPLNGFIVRKERKTYGAGRLIEGVLTPDPIVIVDDLLNSARSLEKVRAVLDHEGHTLRTVFTVVDFRSRRGLDWRANHCISVHSLFRLGDLGLSLQSREPLPLRSTFRDAWRFASRDPNFFHRVPKSSPITDGKRVYFGSDSGVFWSLDCKSGSICWQFHVSARGHKNIWSAPALHNGRVYFGSYDGNVYCLDAINGREIWRFIGADWVGSSPAIAPTMNLLFIGLEFAVEGRRGSVVALDLDSGNKVWEHMTKRYTHASPAVWEERELVACGSNDDEMFMFDARTGSMKWRFETRSTAGVKGSIRHAPAFDKKRGRLVTGCANGDIYIVDIQSGQLIWSVSTENTVYTIPLVVNDLAFVGSTDKHLYVLDLAQQVVLRRIYCGAKVFSPPMLLDGFVYFASCSGMVYELDPVTSAITGTHQLPDAITNAMAYDPEGKLFYALSYVNELFAFARG